ncbi:MAG: hypothetical protein K6G83_12140 [Lachnospiraceae bacterium]|nr:hypothetical protein [Lachnospiraceae bacterium]
MRGNNFFLILIVFILLCACGCAYPGSLLPAGSKPEEAEEGTLGKELTSLQMEQREGDVVDTARQRYTYEEMTEDIRSLCELYPECLSYETVGESLDGREIYKLRLGDPRADKHIFIDAAIHGREYITAQLIMKLVEEYASHYHNGRYQNMTYEDLFGQVCLDIFPMVNPDGVSISQFGEEGLTDETGRKLLRECFERDRKYLVYQEDGNGTFYWADYYRIPDYDKSALPEKYQKEITFAEYLTHWKSNARGVDINDNFDVFWGEADFKSYPSYGAAKGEKPASEPETQILIKESTKEDYACFLHYHSRGQLIYYDSFGIDPETLQASCAIAQKLSEMTGYLPYSTKEHERDKAGFGDYVHVTLKKPGVTVEIGKDPSPVPVREFPELWEKHRKSWAMLAWEEVQGSFN